MIAVNPFTKLPHLYNIHMMEQYKGAQFGELSPHVFAVADAAYRYIYINGCIVFHILIRKCTPKLLYCLFSMHIFHIQGNDE